MMSQNTKAKATTTSQESFDTTNSPTASVAASSQRPKRLTSQRRAERSCCFRDLFPLLGREIQQATAESL